ncbi:MAG: hypothetical protein U9Q15_05660 [Patescibacteria group bacterium]|nr:hypothetical protein [Patescibacteria group bacterium]
MTEMEKVHYYDANTDTHHVFFVWSDSGEERDITLLRSTGTTITEQGYVQGTGAV